MIELQTELARVLRRRQEEIQVPGRRYMANETYLLESGGCAFVPMATLVAAANAGPSDCIDAFRAPIEAIVARHVEPTWQGACMAAYDAGLSSGLYGTEAALTIGLELRRRNAIRKIDDKSINSRRLLELLMRFGSQHGMLLRFSEHAGLESRQVATQIEP